MTGARSSTDADREALITSRTEEARAAILRRHGIAGGEPLGAGSESWVYALDTTRVLRIPRRVGADKAGLERLKRFLDGIAGRLPFPTPQIEAIEPDGVTIERRLSGLPLSNLLPQLAEDRRRTALRRYCETAVAIRSISMANEPFGLLLSSNRVTGDTWPAFFAASLDHHVNRVRPHLETAFGDVESLAGKATALLADLPVAPRKVLAHGDVFPGNVLMDRDLNVTGLVDFGTWTLVAESHYDIAAAVMFAEIDDGCTSDDCAWLQSLLIADAGEDAIPAMTFYRAYFAFTLFDPHDDTGLYPRLRPWSLATLQALSEGTIGDWIAG